MDTQLPTREESIELLYKLKLDKNIIRHVLAVCKKAVEIAQKIKNNGYEVKIYTVLEWN